MLPPHPTSMTPAFHRPESDLECNLCKKTLVSETKLQEHLVEHTFAGCEDRGFNCYICSSVFTSTSGLISHMNEHGSNSKPYDCNRCTVKFFFRAELDHHSYIHDPSNKSNGDNSLTLDDNTEKLLSTKVKDEQVERKQSPSTPSESPEIKREKAETSDEQEGDEDEYIEVEEPKGSDEKVKTTDKNENESKTDEKLDEN